MYVASKLSDSIVKIEKWYTAVANDDKYPFEYERDVCLINVDDTSTDFEWVDDEETAFTFTLQDINEKVLKNGSKQTFTQNKEFKEKYKLESLTLDKTNYSEGEYTKPSTAHDPVVVKEGI